MDVPTRTRLLRPTAPGEGLVCLLSSERASQREAPISRLIEQAEFSPHPAGYTIRLLSSDAMWTLANRFVEEEAECCPAMTFEVEERTTVVLIRASIS